MHRTNHPRSGFSLIELAVVIAIVGLLAAGVLGGKTMLRSAQVKKVLTDATTYRSALNQFKQQYAYYPGDFPTAVQVWGKADGDTNLTTNCAAPTTNASTDGKATCNGNGDGFIANATSPEHFWAWQQLSAAGLIPGVYTGIQSGSTVASAVPGTNVPGGSIKASGYYLGSSGIATTDSGALYIGNYNNALSFGKVVTNNWPSGGILTPKEAADMDRKADDGFPGLGNIRVMTATTNTALGNTACASGDTSTTATYSLSAAGTGCVMGFQEDFKAANANR